MAIWNLWRKKQNDPEPEMMPETEPEADIITVPMPTVIQERRMGYQVANLQEIGRRKRQEDSFAFVNATDVGKILEKGMLAVVADGMGGMKDGKVASETAVAALKQDFPQMKKNNYAAQLQRSVLSAGEKVYQALQGDGGCTMVACILFDEQLYYASVGDSFLYLLRDNQIIRLNRLQNVMQERWRESILDGCMDPEPGRADREASALSGFLGMSGLRDVDFLRRPLRLHDGDTLLLCSDGVAGVLSEETLLQCMQYGTPAQMCAEIGQEIARENREFQDNYTALIIRCSY